MFEIIVEDLIYRNSFTLSGVITCNAEKAH